MKSTWSYIATLIAGIAIGWLAGLSESPIAVTLIAAVLGLAIAAVTALAGLQSDKSVIATVTKIDLGPVALFALGLGLAAPIGIYTRTARWLAPPVQTETLEQTVADWTKIGLEPKVVADALFDKWKAAQPVSQASTEPFLLHGVGEQFCQRIVNELGTINPDTDFTRLQNEVVGSNVPGLAAVAQKLDGPTLKAGVQSYCVGLGVTVK